MNCRSNACQDSGKCGGGFCPSNNIPPLAEQTQRIIPSPIPGPQFSPTIQTHNLSGQNRHLASDSSINLVTPFQLSQGHPKWWKISTGNLPQRLWGRSGGNFFWGKIKDYNNDNGYFHLQSNYCVSVCGWIALHLLLALDGQTNLWESAIISILQIRKLRHREDSRFAQRQVLQPEASVSF